MSLMSMFVFFFGVFSALGIFERFSLSQFNKEGQALRADSLDFNFWGTVAAAKSFKIRGPVGFAGLAPKGVDVVLPIKIGNLSTEVRGTIFPQNYNHLSDKSATLYRNFLGFIQNQLLSKLTFSNNTIIAIVVSVFLLFDVVVSSYSLTNFGLWLKSPASPVMYGIVELHDYVMFIIFLILVFVGCLFVSTLTHFYNRVTFRDSTFSYSPFSFGSKSVQSRREESQLSAIRYSL